MSRRSNIRAWALASAFLVALGLGAAWAQTSDGCNAACSAVVARMVASDLHRHVALHAYSAVRSYHVVYKGLGQEEASMKVRMDYQEPGPKRLTKISESGSGMLRHHVLEPLLKTERDEEETEAKQGPAITPANYDFELVATPNSNRSGDFVLKATPHKGKRFLFEGKIWVNPDDYAIVKVEGAPTDDHSWWVTDTQFTFQNQPMGEFWLPLRNHITSHVRFFGHAVLDITYGEFHITSASPVAALDDDVSIAAPPAASARCPGCSG